MLALQETAMPDEVAAAVTVAGAAGTVSADTSGEAAPAPDAFLTMTW